MSRPIEANEGGGAREDDRRVLAIDIARAIALIAMAVYHFAWDLEFFRYVPAGMTNEGGWRLFARCIASSFLFLVGVSLVMAHRRGIRWRSFLVRLAQIAAAALVISIVTLFATPEAPVHFGILHHIALASLLGLAFLFVPWPLTALAAIFVLLLPLYFRAPLFDPHWLNWTGLFLNPPHSNDFVPVFPFLAAVLAGIAAARVGSRLGLFAWLRRANPALRQVPALAFLGRHALAFYLLHQPILFGLLLIVSQIAPPDEAAIFVQDCRNSCPSAEHGTEFCERYCDCTLDRLQDEELLGPLLEGTPTSLQMSRIGESVEFCSRDAALPPTGRQQP